MSNKKRLTQLFRAVSGLLGNAQQRYEARHTLLSGIARASDFRLYNRNLAWQHDQEFLRVWSVFPYGSKSIHDRKFNLYYLAKAIYNIPGDIAECGVYHGGSSHLMLSASAGTNKYLYGFDSFEGLSEPGHVDLQSHQHTFKWSKNDLSFAVENTEHNLAQHKGSFTLYKGWIPDRFTEVQDKRFSLVHIDVDLYEPTLASLEFFYPRMNPGGMMICDDYGFESCPGARMAMDEFFARRREKSVIHLTTGQGLVICHYK